MQQIVIKMAHTVFTYSDASHNHNYNYVGFFLSVKSQARGHKVGKRKRLKKQYWMCYYN